MLLTQLCLLRARLLHVHVEATRSNQSANGTLLKQLKTGWAYCVGIRYTESETAYNFILYAGGRGGGAQDPVRVGALEASAGTGLANSLFVLTERACVVLVHDPLLQASKLQVCALQPSDLVVTLSARGLLLCVNRSDPRAATSWKRLGGERGGREKCAGMHVCGPALACSDFRQERFRRGELVSMNRQENLLAGPASRPGCRVLYGVFV